METIEIPASSGFLQINLNDGLLQFKGRSIVEDPVNKFKPVLEWIKNYTPKNDSVITANFHIEYLNSTSSKCLLDVLLALDKLLENGHRVVINWYYDEGDEDIMDIGMHMKTHIKAPFNFIETD
jgi:hypothetical protein